MVRALATSDLTMIGTLANETHARTVRLWLYAVAALVLAMVLVGGATRLTEVRPFDHRVEAGDGGGAALVAKRLAGRVRKISGDPAIPRDESAA